MTRHTREEATAARRDLADRLIAQFNRAADPLIGTFKTFKAGIDDYAIEVRLQRNPTHAETAALPASHQGVPVRYRIEPQTIRKQPS